jgi:hypothetical protein
MKIRILAGGLTLLSLSACQQADHANHADHRQHTTEAAMPAGFVPYGEAITAEGAVPVQDVVAQPTAYAGKTVKLAGTVAEVCQAAGCWLTLQTGTGTNVRILVARRADDSYKFTVPKDISGRQVVVEGVLEAATLSKEEADHLAEDAGQEPAAAGDQTELRLTAIGVLVANT